MAGNVLNELAWALRQAGYSYERIGRILRRVEALWGALDEERRCYTCGRRLAEREGYWACPGCGGEWVDGDVGEEEAA